MTKKLERSKIKIVLWYLLVTTSILFFLYALFCFDLIMSVAAFVLAMGLSKYKDSIPLPSFWKDSRTSFYK